MNRVLAVQLIALATACGASKSAPEPAAPTAPAAPQQPGDRATVPLHIEGHRPFVDIAFRKADGSTRTARFLVDSGGGGFLIVEPLAVDLGLQLGPTMEEEGERFARVASKVDASIGGVALDLEPDRVLVLVGKDNMLPPAAPGHADGLLPGHVLAHYHVVFDYPARTFTIAHPGALVPEGTPLSMPVARQSGFPRTEIEVDGKTLGLLLDTGASFTMVSQALLEDWGKAHADWKRHKGAYGEAATLGGQTLETMFIPRVTWGGHALTDVGVVSQQAGVFEKWMSSMMVAPIVGSLAGNVLETFRVDLDYPNQKLYLSRPAASAAH
jgi:predicted aspartyl protease